MCQVQQSSETKMCPESTSMPPTMITTSELRDVEDHYYYDYYYCYSPGRGDDLQQVEYQYEDLGEAYIQIMEACRPFYSLHPPTNSNEDPAAAPSPTSTLYIPPRLDDALALQKNDGIAIGSVVTSPTISTSSSESTFEVMSTSSSC